ncbi:MAG: hypothetical protein HMLKMBBP_00501 [Planctomycetes bacterium]|nr:hypothetical protein [Planctomycetota bacterium]
MQPSAALSATRDDVWDAGALRRPGWGASLRALPPEDRRALLARADAAYGGPEPGHGIALLVYTAARHDLDPGCAADCARMARVIAEGPAMTCADVLPAMVERAVDRELAECARIVLAQRDLVAGDLAKAEEAYVRGMRMSVGRWPVLRANAAAGYARFCLDAGRDVEALVLSRRAADASEALGDAFGAAFARLVEAHVLRNLEDWPRLSTLLDRIRAETPLLPLHGRALMTFGVLPISADLALGEGRLDDAVRWIREAERAAKTYEANAWRDADVNHVLGDVALRRGLFGEALAEYEAALPALADCDDMRLDVATGRVRAMAALGHPGTADAAAAWLADLEAVFVRGSAYGIVFRAATAGGRALAATGRHDDLSRAAYRLAASAALARLREIEAFVTAFPEYASPTAEERDIVLAHRARTESHAEALRTAVAALLEEEIAAGRTPLASLTPPTGLVASCAWCSRLRNLDGAWLHLPESLPSLPEGAVLVTHAICGECSASVCEA